MRCPHAENPEYLFWRGRCYFAFTDFKRALYDFSGAIRQSMRLEREPAGKSHQMQVLNVSEAYQFAGQCSHNLGQHEEALSYYNLAIKKNNKDSQNFYYRGLTFVALQRFEEAIRDFRDAIERYAEAGTSEKDKVFKYRFNLGITLRRVGVLDDSITELKRATEEMPQKAICWNNLGLSHFQNDQWEEAITAYSKAIQFEEGEKKEKKEGSAASAVPERKPEEANDNLSFYYNNRGLANYHSQNMEEALIDYREAIRNNEACAENYFNRGNVFMSRGEHPDAHSDFDRALELEPANAKLYHGKGLAFQA